MPKPTSRMVSSPTLSAVAGVLLAPAWAHAQFDMSGAQGMDPSQAAAAAAPSTAAPATAAGAARSAGAGFASPDGTLGLKPGTGRVIPFDEAMGMTLRNSYDLRIAHEKLFQAQLYIRKAWSAVLPRLTATAGYTFSWPVIEFQAVSQEQLDAQASAQRAQLEGQAQIYDAQAAAAAADGNYNTEYANRALAAQLRAREGSISAGKAPDPVAINPAHVFTAGLNFSLVLFNGRAVPLIYNAYDGVKQAGANIRRGRDTALYMVALGYFQAVSARKLVGIAEKQVENLQHHLDVTRVRVEVGTLPPLAARRGESDLERAKASVRSARSAYQSAVAALGSMLGVEEGFDVGALPPMPPFEDGMTEDALIAHAADTRPDFAAARLALAMAERNRIDALMRWMPTVSLTAAARATSNIRGFQKDPVTYSVMLNASLPLYDGGERYTAWRESGSQVREARLALDQARMKLEMAVRGNLREVSVRKENLVNQRTALKLAEENARDARSRFEVGAATQLEVLDAEQLVISASLDLALAEVDLLTARLALAFVSGGFNPPVSDGTRHYPNASPVVLGALAPVTDPTATLAGDAPLVTPGTRVPALAPPGRAHRAQAVGSHTLSLNPSPAELVRAGLAGGTDALWSAGP
ncbi:MAG: TolC family protein [Deltaproteobacteria bacterium]|nr:TolC family protein [Deltaproteobacteria bacterium]